MKYHLEAVKLLDFEPEIHKILLPGMPESVAEWYSIPQAVDILKQYSNRDKPLTPENFRFEALEHRQIAVFMLENQGVCWWAFELGEQDDPPVFVLFESTPRKWLQACDKFSTFIYTRLFDYRYWADQHLSRMEISLSLNDQILAGLRSSYEEHPTTYGWPGDMQYRFSKNDQRIVLMESEGQTDWYFSADTPQAVEEIYQKYRHLMV